MDRARVYLPLVRADWESAFTISQRSTATASQLTRALAQLAEARLVESKSVNNGNRTVMMYRVDRCPNCSFAPTNLNDYCYKHRPRF
jgi:predicted transcriptional regulator